MIDNFDLLSERLILLKNGDFFPIIVIKRRKDNPEMSKGAQIIYRTNISNIDEYNHIKEKLIDICKKNNARAYIKINKRNNKEISENLVRYVVDKHLINEYDKMQHAYDHIIGITFVKKGKYYQIDVDTNIPINPHTNPLVIKILQKLTEFKGKKMADGDIIMVPTKTGLHILAPAFDIGSFKKEVEQDINTTYDIKQDAETVLYIP